MAGRIGQGALPLHLVGGALGENRGQVVALEKVILFGLTIVEQRTVAYERINPEEAKKYSSAKPWSQAKSDANFPFSHTICLYGIK